MVSAEALFGNYSFVQFLADNVTEMTQVQAYASVCEHGSIPFSQVGSLFISVGSTPLGRCYDAAGNIQRSLDQESSSSLEELDTDLTLILASHTATFNNSDLAEYALSK